MLNEPRQRLCKGRRETYILFCIHCKVGKETRPMTNRSAPEAIMPDVGGLSAAWLVRLEEGTQNGVMKGKPTAGFLEFRHGATSCVCWQFVPWSTPCQDCHSSWSPCRSCSLAFQPLGKMSQARPIVIVVGVEFLTCPSNRDVNGA